MSRIDTATTAGAVLVAIIYHLTKRTQQSPSSNEWDTRVVYYLDDRIALRARYDGIAEKPTISPDPRHDGTLVACFESSNATNSTPTDGATGHE